LLEGLRQIIFSAELDAGRDAGHVVDGGEHHHGDVAQARVLLELAQR
jgi:hypothetical protein